MSATNNATPDLFERVVRALGVAYSEWTPGEDRIHPSPALATLFDLDPEDWTVQRMLDHMHPDDRPGYKAALTAFMKSDAERTEIPYRYHRWDGGLRWCLNHHYAERDAGGRVTRLTTAVTDVTKEKEQEAANRALLARQEASAEVLKAITASPDDPQPVFELIAQKVKELYGAHAVSVVEYDGELLHQRALIGHEPEAAARLLAAFPRPPGPETGPGRVFLSGKPVYFRNIDNESGIIPAGRTASLGVGSYLAVPLLHEGRVVGVLGLWRADFGEFNESLVEVAQAFAEQAVIAISGAKTLRELRERDVENRALIARQQASIEVLRAISESPDDTQPVFELIARHARTLCGATSVSMTEYDGTLMHARVSDWADPEARDAWFATYPRPPGPETGHGRATLSGKTGHVRDVSADPLIYQAGRRVSTGSSMHVPLLRDGRAIGAIVLLRAVAGGFTDSEAALVESFAEQASLAIASATTLRNLRARTAELQEALDQQTATTEVLGVINASPGDLTPVFDAMLERALRLCGAYGGGLLIQDGAHLKYQAIRGMPPSFTARRLGQASGVDSDSPPGRMLRTGRTIQVVDTLTDPYFVSRPELRDQTTGLGGARSVLNVPLLKDGAVCGAFVIFRETPGAWPDRQIALLENFAAQAVVAMENARLLTETREALEQQTATTEVLQVINASPGDLAPVFDAILEKSLLLAQSAFGIIYLHENDIVQAIASRAVPEALKQYYAERQPPRASTYPPAQRLKETKRGYQLLDIREGPNYRAGVPGPRAVADLGGARSLMDVPLIKDQEVIGSILIYRQEVRAFTDKHIALLENFAAQAVIAMENARLLTETREALAQQTATAEVLGVINASPGNLTPVFDAILEKAMRLCGAAFGHLGTWDGERAHPVASRGLPPAFAAYRASRGPTGALAPMAARLMESKRSVQVADVRDSEGYRNGHPTARAVADLGGARTLLHVPLLRDEAFLGILTVYRQEQRLYSDKEIALLESFAAQAVIAMENARLLTETREALEQQTATAEVLGVINASPGNLVPVFDAMLEKAMRLCGAAFGILRRYNDGRLHVIASRGVPDAFADYSARNPVTPPPNTSLSRALASGEPDQLPDIRQQEGYEAAVGMRAIAELGGARTILQVPLVKDGVSIALFTFYRQEVRSFSDKDIALVKTFAAQAVIAMENARLLTELHESLDQQTATAEVLAVINASPGNLTPVFDAILDKALRICQPAFGSLTVFEASRIYVLASRGETEALAEYRARNPGNSFSPNVMRLIETKRPIHVLDLRESEGYRSGHPGPIAVADLGGARSFLLVPLIKDQTVIGTIQIYRQEVRAFSDKESALVENFAAQAVIAMENARLIGELRQRTSDLQESLEYQTATSDVLKVISRSTFDLTPVLDTLLAAAARLCDADSGGIATVEGDGVRVATHYSRDGSYRSSTLGQRLPLTRATILGRTALEGRIIHVEDVGADAEHVSPDALHPELRGTMLGVPLLRDGAVLGSMRLARNEVRPFTDRQVELVSTFADQAVIAIENTRLLTEQREALEQQTATAEVLQVINANPGDLTPVFEAMLGKAMTLGEADFGLLRSYDGERAHPLASRGLPAAFAATIARRIVVPQGPLMQSLATGAPVQTLDVKELDLYKTGELAPLVDLGGARTVLNVPLVRDQVPVGYFTFYRQEVRAFTDKQIALMQNFASQAVIAMENARLLGELRSALETTQATLRDLKIAQANLIQAEKMASLGQLTAGIAHEIKNPLNFVNNFAALSVDLLEELKETAAPGFATLTDDQRADIDDVSAMLTTNLQKITEHGKRADGIVKAMLEHSRGSSGERRDVDLNALVDEALNLAYHGARAQDQSFNITLERDYADGIAPIEVNPQDLTRVFLNIFSNGFYAANKRAKERADPSFDPVLRVSTRALNDTVEIRIRDNGTGIPADIRDKLFQPFFTTKPTGEGTGLGLSITYDIVTKQHGGTIEVESEPGAFTEFVVTIPRQMFAGTESRT